MTTQRPRVHGHPVAREINKPSVRDHRVEVEPPELERLDLGDPRDRLLQIPARRLRRPLTPPLEIREPLTVRTLQEPLKPPALPRRQQPGQRFPQTFGRLLTHPGDQPCERCDPRQQYVALKQPADRVVADRPRAITRRPRPCVHPFLKLPRDLRDIPEPAGAFDLLGVLEAGSCDAPCSEPHTTDPRSPADPRDSRARRPAPPPDPPRTSPTTGRSSTATRTRDGCDHRGAARSTSCQRHQGRTSAPAPPATAAR